MLYHEKSVYLDGICLFPRRTAFTGLEHGRLSLILTEGQYKYRPCESYYCICLFFFFFFSTPPVKLRERLSFHILCQQKFGPLRTRLSVLIKPPICFPFLPHCQKSQSNTTVPYNFWFFYFYFMKSLFMSFVVSCLGSFLKRGLCIKANEWLKQANSTPFQTMHCWHLGVTNKGP